MTGHVETLAERIANFARDLNCDDTPPEVIHAARLQILDTLGVIAAAHFLNEGVAARAVVSRMAGRDEATVVGHSQCIPSPNAALANGMMAHALDFDDSHVSSMVHVSSVVVPAALAAAEVTGAPDRELIAAVIVATEVVIRLGLVDGERMHANGWHTTPVVGVFAAALASARLHGLDVPGMVSALGIAGSQAGGIGEFVVDGAGTKQLHPGWAAHAGLIACALAKEGVTGPRTVFEGRRGFLTTHLGRAAEGLNLAPFDDLGTKWHSTTVEPKFYPVCHAMHPYLDALIALRARHQIQPEAVTSISVEVPGFIVPLVLEPITDKVRPTRPREAKFSLPFCSAIVLQRGRLDLDCLTPEVLKDPGLLRLASRVSYTVDPGITGITLAGAVHVETADGTRRSEVVPIIPGSDFDTSARLAQKFKANAASLLGDAVDEIAGVVMALGGDRCTTPGLMAAFRT